MNVSLAELAGFQDDDPEVVAARADAGAYADLIEGLVELRHRRRMTQDDVAEAMGTTQSVVSHFERLGGDARISTVQRYARAVGAQLRWLTSTDDERAVVQETEIPLAQRASGSCRAVGG
ncbi:MAG: helix-turn-helix domain-containing protein [Pseudonocardiaceae bacterium]